MSIAFVTNIRSVIIVSVAFCIVIELAESCGSTSTNVERNVNSFSDANPFTSAIGLGTMHGDTASSDTTPYSGPGSGPIISKRIGLLADCPSLLQGNDGFITALYVSMFRRKPTVYMVREVYFS